jgi:hypothetical protein
MHLSKLKYIQNNIFQKYLQIKLSGNNHAGKTGTEISLSGKLKAREV